MEGWFSLRRARGCTTVSQYSLEEADRDAEGLGRVVKSRKLNMSDYKSLFVWNLGAEEERITSFHTEGSVLHAGYLWGISAILVSRVLLFVTNSVERIGLFNVQTVFCKWKQEGVRLCLCVKRWKKESERCRDTADHSSIIPLQLVSAVRRNH